MTMATIHDTAGAIGRFLTARWDEAEKREHAKRVNDGGWFGRPCPACGTPVESYSIWDERSHGPESRTVQPCRCALTAQQMSALLGERPNPDPAALADLAAKRAILAAFHNERTDYGYDALLVVVVLLAQPYRDHDDFDPLWTSTG